ncbi:hypothetical protein [Nocardioides sp. B-3]|uniref:hypothetical protein n=1 Tax=Nocardioides sp. B-3 TaxID=2895565 RepID=UPI00215312E6|nr:hypothetical protein [Nocardioides sp. B-3]UUZ58623.1 hypothetical protein LP418_21170 [Nocardioides sp. B-3]
MSVAGSDASTGAGRRRALSEAGWARLMVSPLLLGLGVFYLWPIVQTLYFSFTEWGPFGGHTRSGPENYRRLVADEEVRGPSGTPCATRSSPRPASRSPWSSPRCSTTRECAGWGSTARCSSCPS